MGHNIIRMNKPVHVRAPAENEVDVTYTLGGVVSWAVPFERSAGSRMAGAT